MTTEKIFELAYNELTNHDGLSYRYGIKLHTALLEKGEYIGMEDNVFCFAIPDTDHLFSLSFSMKEGYFQLVSFTEIETSV